MCEYNGAIALRIQIMLHGWMDGWIRENGQFPLDGCIATARFKLKLELLEVVSGLMR